MKWDLRANFNKERGGKINKIFQRHSPKEYFIN
jgi:hypothetical protein